jgi:hypothetical protein
VAIRLPFPNRSRAVRADQTRFRSIRPRRTDENDLWLTPATLFTASSGNEDREAGYADRFVQSSSVTPSSSSNTPAAISRLTEEPGPVNANAEDGATAPGPGGVLVMLVPNTDAGDVSDGDAEPVELEADGDPDAVGEAVGEGDAVAETDDVGDAEVLGEADAVGEADVVGEAEVVGEADVVAETDDVGDAEVLGETEAVGEADVVGEAEAVGDWLGLPEGAGSTGITALAEILVSSAIALSPRRSPPEEASPTSSVTPSSWTYRVPPDPEDAVDVVLQ